MTIDLTPEAVERLAERLTQTDKTKHGYYGYVAFNRDGKEAAATLRALSARVVELEAALATARADALREAANKAVITAAIYDPGSTQGYKGDRTLTEWQADAVVYAILDLIPQEKPHE
jgi:hypothetical protein